MSSDRLAKVCDAASKVFAILGPLSTDERRRVLRSAVELFEQDDADLDF